MGIGDWIMATGEARRRQATDPRPVVFTGPDGRPYWSEVFENNPRIARFPTGHTQQLVNGGGVRPYIQRKEARRWIWRPYKPTPGEFYFTRPEAESGQRGAGYLIVEPTIKRNGHDNKDWGWSSWLVYAELALKAGLPIAQVGPPGVRLLPGVPWIKTATFREGAAVLAHARGYVGHEGGLHHAAAAVSKPAVVIFGGFISPDVTGYDTHDNLFTGKAACGSRVRCGHCRQAMSAIKPAYLLERTQRMLG